MMRRERSADEEEVSMLGVDDDEDGDETPATDVSRGPSQLMFEKKSAG